MRCRRRGVSQHKVTALSHTKLLTRLLYGLPPLPTIFPRPGDSGLPAREILSESLKSGKGLSYL